MQLKYKFMTQQEISQRNEAIALFDGWKFYNYDREAYPEGRWILEFVEYEPSELKYHSDWNWLMPVVEKLCQMQFEKDPNFNDRSPDTHYIRTFGMINEDGNLMVRINRHRLYEAKTLIEATFLAISDFCIWYNEQSKKETK